MDAGTSRSRLRCKIPNRFSQLPNKVHQYDGVVQSTLLAIARLLVSFSILSNLGIAQDQTQAQAASSSSRETPTRTDETISIAQLQVPATVWPHLRSAHKKFRNRDLAGAAREIEIALQIDPLCAPAFSMRVFIKLAAGNAKGALEDAQHAATLDPRDPDSFVGQAMAYNVLEEFGQASEASRHALALTPDLWQARLEMVKSLDGEGESASALRELERVNQDFPDVHLVRGRILMRLGRDREAVNEFGIFLKQETSDQRASQIRKIVLALQARLEEASSTDK